MSDAYYESVQELGRLVEQGAANITLMGIEPTYPSEKYGYIIPMSADNVSPVKEFKEAACPTRLAYAAQMTSWSKSVLGTSPIFLPQYAQRR